MYKLFLSFAAATACLLLAHDAAAQTRTILSAGGNVLSDGNISVAFSVGQPIIGPAAQNYTRTLQGFWYYGYSADAISAVTGRSDATGLLMRCLPNPATTTATISFGSDLTGDAELVIYDAVGNPHMTLFTGTIEAGQEIDLPLQAADMPSGYYTATLSVGTTHRSISVLIAK